MKAFASSLLALAVLPACASAQEASATGPEAVAVSLMSQFYDVPVSQVTTQVTRTGLRTDVLASTPEGHSCTFEVAKITAGADEVARWGVASTACDNQ